MRDPLEAVAADGTITTGAARHHVGAEFEPVLRAVVDSVAGVDNSAAVYVYGSVATGQAVVGRSDVDVLTIGLPSDDARGISADLTEQFTRLCRVVEIGPASDDDFIGDGDEAYGNRIFLRHYCVLLGGRDRSVGLPSFPADRRAARGFNGDIGQHARRWSTALAAGEPAPVVAQRIARKTLLAVAALVSVHDRTWTTDRMTAAKRWAALEPAMATGLDRLLGWIDGAPEATPDDVLRMLDETIGRVVEQFTSTVGLWESTG